MKKSVVIYSLLSAVPVLLMLVYVNTHGRCLLTTQVDSQTVFDTSHGWPFTWFVQNWADTEVLESQTNLRLLWVNVLVGVTVVFGFVVYTRKLQQVFTLRRNWGRVLFLATPIIFGVFLISEIESWFCDVLNWGEYALASTMEFHSVVRYSLFVFLFTGVVQILLYVVTGPKRNRRKPVDAEKGHIKGVRQTKTRNTVQ